MKNMKLDKQAMRENAVLTQPSDYTPDYPWGLKVHIDDDTMRKLGIDALPEVGAEFMLKAKCFVCSVSYNDSENSKEHMSMSLQITDMALDKEKKATKAGEEVFYGK